MLTIRKARREDALAAWAIRNAAILHQCADHYSADILATWTGGELSTAFSDTVEQHFHVATYDNDVVGTGMINMETGQVDAIFVHPSHMQKGIGKKIVEFLEGIALKHGLEKMALESTLNAAAFYRTCGFEGNDVSTYVSPRGISMECIPMVKVIGAHPTVSLI